MREAEFRKKGLCRMEQHDEVRQWRGQMTGPMHADTELNRKKRIAGENAQKAHK